MTENGRITELEHRVDALSRRVSQLEAARGAPVQGPAAPTAAVPTAPPAVPRGYWVPTQPLPGAAAAGPQGQPATGGAVPGRSVPEITPSRLLALAGGLILLLGIGYLVRFAVAQGWLGPEVRIVLALVASAVIAGVGLRLEQRADTRTIGQICTVTGVAGTYTAVVAATVGYRLLPDALGMLIAAAVAAAAVVRGVWARGQWIAALGVGGALAAPAIVNAVPAAITLALLVVLLAGGLWVAVRQQWPLISGLSFLLVTPQLWNVATGTAPLSAGLPLLAVCGLLFLAAAIGHTRADAPLAGVAPVLVALNAASVAATGWSALSDALPAGSVAPAWWVAGVAAVHLLAAAVVARARPAAPVAVVASVAGFVAADTAVLMLLDGHAVQLAYLGLAAVALGASRLLPALHNVARAGIVIQLVAAGGHALSVELALPAPGSLEALLLVLALSAVAVALPVATRHLGSGLVVAVAVVPLGLAITRLLGEEAPLQALLDGPDDLLVALGMCLAIGAAMAALGWLVHRRFWAGAIAVANYGVSLAAVAMDPQGLGRVALTGLWATGGAAALIGGRTLRRPDLRRAGAGLLAAALTKALLVDTVTLDGTNRAAALLLCGSVLVFTAVVEARAAAKTPPAAPTAQ